MGLTLTKPLTPFPEEFSKRYPTAAATVFIGQSFRNAMAEASRQHKFLLVYIHSEEHPSSRPFIVSILSDPTLSRYIQEHFLLWGADVREAEGMKCFQQLGGTSFPFLCVVVRAASRDQVVLKCQGELTVEVLLAALTGCVHDNGAAFIVSRAEARDTLQRQVLREQQQAELQAALLEDQERDRLEREARAAEEELRHKEEEEKRREEEQKMRQMEAKALAISRVTQEPSADVKGAITARIFLLDGSFVERRFLESDTVHNIADYVLSQERHQGSDNFDIQTKFPVAVLPRGATLQSLGLPQRAVLVVRKSSDE
jgi:FAS-associated factor 2